ncbi:hypothetical protein DTO021C3_1583 [Paecilomyces variotii]|nr:hypothetical protein DTO021C3_1583 [Paecilomyces variotii]KAJ9309336.1 hypothetical protein DTO217A2_1274 [Paecilomyces variotii]KAJ9375152.1 hypothetical protein DTO282E5_136 [Paecilomyces variotii]KAJ9398118.1 hypothetical protein DTO282F9_5028 [Paecilomyces variotii]
MTLQTCVGLAPFPDFPGLKLKGPSTALIGWSLLLGAVLHGAPREMPVASSGLHEILRSHNIVCTVFDL